MSDPRSTPPTAARLGAWGELLRLPNLLTVPGDPLAGFVLAGLAVGAGPWTAALPAVGVALLLYAGGVIHNDLQDLAEDRRDRPGRPLPSGRVGPVQAAGANLLLFAGALLLALLTGPAGLAVAAGLLAMVVAYNALLKRVAGLGPLAMGSCRGLSLLLGAASAGGWAGVRAGPVLLSAAGLTLYIAAVSVIAAGETRPRTLGWRRWGPAGVLAAWLVALHAMLPGGPWASGLGSLALAALAVAWALRQGLGLGGVVAPPVAQQTVGALLRGLLLIQAALVALAGTRGIFLAAALLLLGPIHALLARRFRPS